VYLLNAILHNQDRVIDTTVNISAIPILSNIDGCKLKSGKISNCIKIASMYPDPTSIKLSIKLLIE